MEKEPVKLSVYARAWYQSPSILEDESTVVIRLSFEKQEFTVNESDGCVSPLGSAYPSSPPLSHPISLTFQNFTPDYVYQHLQSRFHDSAFSRKLCDEIVVEAQRLSRPSSPLFMEVFAKLTQKVFIFVPSTTSSSVHPITDDLESENCAICLEDLSESETKPICQLPHCTHSFHEECIIKWLDGHNNSCPLCRKTVYKHSEPEELS